MAARVVTACGGSVRGKTIAVLGLTFKPETDDMRDAPSLPIVHRLVEEGAIIRAFDPEGMERRQAAAAGAVVFCADAPEAMQGADALVLITEWNEFRALSPERLKQEMRGRRRGGSAQRVRPGGDAGVRAALLGDRARFGAEPGPLSRQVTAR